MNSYSSYSIQLVHKKRLRRDRFLSNLQHCLQPPYSANHFYAFDQINLLKLQRKLEHEQDPPSRLPTSSSPSFVKRKYSDEHVTHYERASPFKRSWPQTADPLSPSRYAPREIVDEPDVNNEKTDTSLNPTSAIILSRLEKILHLCGELRSLAKDVEQQVNTVATVPEQTVSKATLPMMNDNDPSDSEQTLIDIYKELETQQSSPPTNVHEPQPASQTNSRSNLRRPEDLCLCFLKSFFHKDSLNADELDGQLTVDEQEYLNELTRAYVLGREQILREQQEQQVRAVQYEHTAIDLHHRRPGNSTVS